MRAFGIACAAAALALFLGCEKEVDEGTPFLVISSYPANGQTNVPPASVVTIRTTHPVDHTTVTGTKQVILVNQANTVVPVSYTFNGEYLVLTPGSPLSANATYGVAVRPGVRDVYGSNIQTPYALTFSTGPQVSSIPNWPPFTLTTSTTPPALGPPGTFTPVAPLWIPRARHTSNLLNDGRVLVCGGESVVGFATVEFTCELFDPGTLQWTPVLGNWASGMYFPRAGHAATAMHDGRILVTGGTPSGKQAHNTAEIYDPRVDLFYLVPAFLNVGRMFHTSTLLPNGNILLAGGATSTLSNTGFMVTPLTDTIEVFDVNSGTFQMSQANLTQGFIAANPALSAFIVIGLVYHTANMLPDNKVLFMGGLTFISSPLVLNNACTYTPDLTGVGIMGSMTATGNNLMIARAEHRSTLIPDKDAAGLIIVTGGLNTTSTHMNAEIFDYNMLNTQTNRKGVFRYLASNLTINRRSHTSTFIPATAYAGRSHPWGKILVAGGSQQVGTAGQAAPYPPHLYPFLEVVGCGGCSATRAADIFDPFQFGYKNPSLPFLGIDQTGQFQATRDPQGVVTTIPQCPFMGRYWHTAEGLFSGAVLIAGGYDCVFCIPGPAEGQILQTACIYNP
jgi:hypothetical protein